MQEPCISSVLHHHRDYRILYETMKVLIAELYIMHMTLEQTQVTQYDLGMYIMMHACMSSCILREGSPHDVQSSACLV